MPKGPRHAAEHHSHEIALAEFLGRIKERVILFCAETGLGAYWVAERLADSLHPLGPPWPPDPVQDLRSGARQLGAPLAEVEVAQRALRDGQTPHHPGEVQSHRGQTLEAQRGRGVPPSAIKAYWAKMTPEERSRESKRRMKKWSPKAKAKWLGSKSKAAGKKQASDKKRREKQQVYAARAYAKKKGLPLPPKPSAIGKKYQNDRPKTA